MGRDVCACCVWARIREQVKWLEDALDDARVHVIGRDGQVWHCNGVPSTVRWRDIQHLGCDPTFLGSMAQERRAHFSVEYMPEMERLLGESSQSSLRELLPIMEPAMANVLAYACGLLSWHHNSMHCGRCGGRNVVQQSGHSKVCSQCHYTTFPRTDPAVIMLVTDPSSNRCILGRNAKWEKGRFSTLAGFVEPGESLEDAVTREVLEEVGVHVNPRSVRYHGSQPWPFPQSLMLGFFCEGSGEIVCNPHEIEEARWFSAEEARSVVKLPGPTTIARSLISTWMERKQ